MITASTRFFAVITPSRMRPTTIAIATTPPATTRWMSVREAGFGTSWLIRGSIFRVRPYCRRPSAMPTAARPKPQWKPTLSCR